MKTTWKLTLVALGWIGLLANVQAVAQNGSPVPTATKPVLPDSQAAPVATPGMANNQVPDSAAQVLNGAPVATPAAMLDPTADNSLLMDNGLWDGAPVPPCCAICGGGSGCPPDWYTEQGVRLLGRSRSREIMMGSNFTGNVFVEDLSNRKASPDVSLSYATTIGHYFARDKLNNDHFVEFSFWGLNGWKDSASVNGERLTDSTSQSPDVVKFGSLFSSFYNPITGFSVNGFDRADQQSIYYSSYMNNFEINGRISPRSREDRLVLEPNGRWRRECQQGQYISYLYGLRFLQLDETFRFHSVGTTDTYNGAGVLINSVTHTGDYDVNAHNNLLGLQIGTDLTFRQCRWSWGVRAKTGAFINFSDQLSMITPSPQLTETTRRMSSAKHEASFLGEVGFMATYKFRPNLMGRAAYDFNWITGLALAPEQLQFSENPVTQINTNGLLFYHGISLGLEWLW